MLLFPLILLLFHKRVGRKRYTLYWGDRREIELSCSSAHIKAQGRSVIIDGVVTEFACLAPVVQTSDSAIHRINHYPVDRVIDFRNTYLLDSDLSGG